MNGWVDGRNLARRGNQPRTRERRRQEPPETEEVPVCWCVSDQAPCPVTTKALTQASKTMRLDERRAAAVVVAVAVAGDGHAQTLAGMKLLSVAVMAERRMRPWSEWRRMLAGRR